MVILFFVGAIAGGQNVFRMAKSIYDEPDEHAKRINEEDAKQEHAKGVGSRSEGHGDIKKGK